MSLNDDVLYEILLVMSIQEMPNFLVNHKMKNILLSDYFWYAKLKYNNLPIPSEKILKKLNWFNMYKLLVKAKKEANDILVVNKIEAQRLHFKSKGEIILLPYDYYVSDLYFTNLKEILKNNQCKSIGIKIVFTLNLRIPDQYKLKYIIYDTNLKTINEITEITLTNENVILNILILFLLNMYIDKTNSQIVDNDATSFRYLPNITDDQLSSKLRDRYNTYESLHYMNI